MFKICLFIIIALKVVSSGRTSSKPNILYIMLDDWGYSDAWNNAGNDGDFELSYLSNLWNNKGLKLTNYYANPSCSPTRSSLLTGKYSFRSDIVDPFGTFARVGMNVNDKTLPEYLKEAGYYNVLSGKWHLGYSLTEFLPTNRGFDEAFFLATAMHTDHYNHTSCGNIMSLGVNTTTYLNWLSCTGTDQWCYYDLWNTSGIIDTGNNYYENQYDGDLWVKHILDFLNSRGNKKNNGDPWFLYWADNAPHSPVALPPTKDIYGNTVNYTNCEVLANANRKTYCKMVTYVENNIKIVINKLRRLNLYKDTIIIITSDNGGEPGVYSYPGATGISYNAYGQNIPLRGSKLSTFEGGIKVPCFITGGYLKNKFHGKSYDKLFHVTDWLPTLLNMVERENNANISIVQPIDGINQWNNILNLNNNHYNFSNNSRTETCFIQYYTNIGALSFSYLRQNDMKLLVNGGGAVVGGDVKDQYHIKYDGTVVTPTANISSYAPIMLFNITNDPYEYHNLASLYPSLVASMVARLQQLRNGQSWTFWNVATKGQIAYIYDHYDLNEQFGLVGSYREASYYDNLDGDASVNINDLFTMFFNSDTCVNGDNNVNYA